MRHCRMAIYEEMTMTDQETYDRTLDAPSPVSAAAEPRPHRFPRPPRAGPVRRRGVLLAAGAVLAQLRQAAIPLCVAARLAKP